MSDLSSGNWLGRLGFHDNPFFQDPVPPDQAAMKAAFIDRENEKKKVERFVSLPKGRLLILGRTGEGKSSLLNLAQQLAKQREILCVRIDGSLCSTLDKILEMLLYELKKGLEGINDKMRSRLAEAVKELDIEEVSEEEREKVEASVEGGIAGLIAYLKAKVGFNLETGRTVVYRPRIPIRTETIVGDILPALFTQLPIIIVFDNTEKLQQKEFRSTVEAIDKLPRDALYIATANYEETEQADMDLCRRVFGDSLKISPVDEASIGQFVAGRIMSYSIDGKPRVEFDPEAVKSLFERTRGNLRETFRYCFGALEVCADARKDSILIKRQMIVQAIADKDAPIFAVLKESDKLLLGAIAKTEVSTLAELEKELSGVEGVGSQETIRRRLEDHAKSGLVRITSRKRNRTRVAQYSMPKVLIEAIDLGELLKVETG